MLTMVASMERELSGVRRGLRPTPGHELRVVGIGPDRAADAMRRILSSYSDAEDTDSGRRRAVLMMGVAGAVDPELKAGDLILASAYLREATRLRPGGAGDAYDAAAGSGASGGVAGAASLAPDPGMGRLAERAAARAGLPVSRGPSMTVDAVVNDLAEKARLHQDFGASSVNMEDFAAAAAALGAVAAVPFLSARVVLDTCRQPLPAYLGSLSGGSPSGPVSRAVLAAAARPWRIAELASLAARMRQAQSVLARFALAFLAEFEADQTAAVPALAPQVAPQSGAPLPSRAVGVGPSPAAGRGPLRLSGASGLTGQSSASGPFAPSAASGLAGDGDAGAGPKGVPA